MNDEQQQQEEDNGPLIGDKSTFEALRIAYQNASSPGFLPGIDHLSKSYQSMRSVKRDGNCFYRALLFGILHLIIHPSRNFSIT